MARIPSNGIHKSEPQDNHIKDIRVVMKSAILTPYRLPTLYSDTI